MKSLDLVLRVNGIFTTTHEFDCQVTVLPLLFAEVPLYVGDSRRTINILGRSRALVISSVWRLFQTGMENRILLYLSPSHFLVPYTPRKLSY